MREVGRYEGDKGYFFIFVRRTGSDNLCLHCIFVYKGGMLTPSCQLF